MEKTYSQIIGVMLIVLGVAGFLGVSFGGLYFTAIQYWLHLLSGLVLTFLGFKGSVNSQRAGAKIFGVIYLLLLLLGLLQFIISLYTGLFYFTPMSMIIYLVIAGWGLRAGVFSMESVTAVFSNFGGRNMETVATEGQRYKTLLAFGKFFSLVGWIVVAIGGIMFLVGLGQLGQQNIFGGGTMGLVSGLLIAVYGIMLVASGQGISCFVSIENNTHATMLAQQAILNMMRGQSQSSGQTPNAS